MYTRQHRFRDVLAFAARASIRIDCDYVLASADIRTNTRGNIGGTAMRLSIILMTAFALALPISAQAESKAGSGGGSKSTGGSPTAGSGASTASPSLLKHVATGRHFDNGTITAAKSSVKKVPAGNSTATSLHVRKAGGEHVEY